MTQYLEDIVRAFIEQFDKDLQTRNSGNMIGTEEIMYNIDNGVYVKEADEIMKDIDYNDSLEFLKIANERFKLEKQEQEDERYIENDSAYVPSDESISSDKMKRIIASKFLDIKYF